MPPHLKDQFDAYARSFLTGNPDKDSPYQLKIDHTHRVCDNIRRIGESAKLSSSQLAMAQTPVGMITVNDYHWNRPEKMTLPGRTTRNFSHDALMRVKGITSTDPDRKIKLLNIYISLHFAILYCSMTF